jgi:uncharacterized protein
MPSPEFTIPVASLDAAGKPYKFPIRAAWVRGALEGHEATAPQGAPDGMLDVRVSKSGNDVVVHGHLTAELTAPCARCLDPVKIVVDQPISALLVPKSAARAETPEYEFAAEEAEMLTYEGETVALDDMVRDELVLETPMIPLCREDCPGMSPPPGRPENPEPAMKPIDPRLAPLLRFKADRTNKE